MEHLESQLVADRLSTHRNNLLSALRLSVQTIVDQACFSVIDDDCEAYQQLCVALEHIFMLGYRGPALKGLITSKGDRPRHYWYVIERCAKRSRAFETVRHMDGVKSRLGRCRAWVMTGLVQKSLAHDLKTILSARRCIGECYDDGAILRLEVSQMVAGLLVALEAVDFSVCLRGNPRLDCQVTPVINFSLFMHAKRSFVGQLSDEDELRRSRMAFDSPAVSPTSDSTGDTDETDGGGAGVQVPSRPQPGEAVLGRQVPSLPQPGEAVLGQQVPAPALLSGVGRSHAPFNSALTMEGSKEFVSLQRQLTDERNQNRYLEDVLTQKKEERERMAQDTETLSRKLREVCNETEVERVTMQNIIIELNEKLCAQERALNSLLARYEDREGLANADVRAAVDALHHRESRDAAAAAATQVSPVRNVKSFFSRIGKSLTAERDVAPRRPRRPGFSDEDDDDEELLDMTVEEGVRDSTSPTRDAASPTRDATPPTRDSTSPTHAAAQDDGDGDDVHADVRSRPWQHAGHAADAGPWQHAGHAADAEASDHIEQLAPQDHASPTSQTPPPPQSAASSDVAAADDQASPEAAASSEPGEGVHVPEGASVDATIERRTDVEAAEESQETGGDTADDVIATDSPPLMDATREDCPSTSDAETAHSGPAETAHSGPAETAHRGDGSGYELEVSQLADDEEDDDDDDDESDGNMED